MQCSGGAFITNNRSVIPVEAMPGHFWITRKTSKLHCNTKRVQRRWVWLVGKVACLISVPRFGLSFTLKSCADHCICTEHFTVRATRWMFCWCRACRQILSVRDEHAYRRACPSMPCAGRNSCVSSPSALTAARLSHTAQAWLQDRHTVRKSSATRSGSDADVPVLV